VPIPDGQLFPSGYSSANSIFQLLIVGAGEFAQGSVGTDEQRQVNVVDDFSIASGSHQLKFGVDYRWLSPFTSPPSYGQFAEFTGLSANPGGALSSVAAVGETKSFHSDALLNHNL
jgi:hypothetical protein